MIKVWFHKFKGKRCAKVYSTESRKELLAWAAKAGYGTRVIHFSRKNRHPHIDLTKSIRLADGLPSATRREMVNDVRAFFKVGV